MRRYLLAGLALLASCAPPRTPGPVGPVELVIASTTDVHGRLRSWDYYANTPETVRGLARAATILDSLRAAHPGRVILVDAGDLLQGNPLAHVAAKVSGNRASPIVAAMNAMRYDAAALGNHEFNYGVPYLDSVVRQASFPFLSANTFRVEPRGVHAYKSWTIVERQGVKVGIVGATTPGVMIWDAENVRGRLFLGDIVPAVRAAVSEVRGAGADVVIVTVHSGLNEPSSYDTVSTGVPSENVAGRIAAEVSDIDLIVYGHSHRESRGTTVGQTLLIQPKNWATSVAVARLRLERTAGKWRVTSRSGEIIPAAGHAEHAAIVAVTDAAHRETVGYVTTPIGTTTERWSADSARVKDTPIIDFILETQRKVAGTDLASTAAFSTDVSFAPGSITVANVAQLYPYENTLRAIRITGRELRAYLEFSARYWRTASSASSVLESDPSIPGYNFDIVSGVDYVIDVTRPVGSRVTTLDYKGAEVRDVDTFTMALNNYRQTGGGGYSMLSGAPVIPLGEPEIRQLLIDEVKKRGDLRQADYFTPNWRIVRGREGVTTPGAAPDRPSTAAARSAFPAGTRFLRIIGTNDFHGALEPRPDPAGVRRGGAAHVARAIDNAIRECGTRCDVVLVDGGDMWQGTSVSGMTYGRTVVDYYNRIGYAAAALGNHEFDWGTDTLRARMREARFGILGANVRYSDGRDVEWIRNDTIVTRGNTKIGIIGLSTVQTAHLSLATNVAGLRFDSPAPIVDSIGRSLRARGADFVVVIAHAGARCENQGTTHCAGEIVDLARNLTTKVDAIVSGHTHSLVNAVINGIPVVQARTAGRAIDIVDIPIGNRSSLTARQEVRELGADTLPALPSIDTLVRTAAAAIASVKNRHIVTIPETLPRRGKQYPLGNLVADAQRWAGKGDVAIMNNGGIRAELRGGDVTYGALLEVQPFGNTLHSIRMTGTQLRALLEQMLGGQGGPDDHISGMTVRYDPARPKGSRVVSVVMADGTPLSDARSYNVIMNNFMIGRGAGYDVAASIPSTPLNIGDIDALIGYLKQLPTPITAPTEVRIAPVSG